MKRTDFCLRCQSEPWFINTNKYTNSSDKCMLIMCVLDLEKRAQLSQVGRAWCQNRRIIRPLSRFLRVIVNSTLGKMGRTRVSNRTNALLIGVCCSWCCCWHCLYVCVCVVALIALTYTVYMILYVQYIMTKSQPTSALIIFSIFNPGKTISMFLIFFLVFNLQTVTPFEASPRERLERKKWFNFCVVLEPPGCSSTLLDEWYSQISHSHTHTRASHSQM